MRGGDTEWERETQNEKKTSRMKRFVIERTFNPHNKNGKFAQTIFAESFIRMERPCHTCECVMSLMWMSHVKHMNASFHTYWWVVSYIWIILSHTQHLPERAGATSVVTVTVRGIVIGLVLSLAHAIKCMLKSIILDFLGAQPSLLPVAVCRSVMQWHWVCCSVLHATQDERHRTERVQVCKLTDCWLTSEIFNGHHGCAPWRCKMVMTWAC